MLINIGLKRYSNSLSWLLLEKFFRLFFSIFISIWVARYLGPYDFGILSYAQSVVFLALSFANLGLDDLVTQNIVEKKCDVNYIMGTACLLKLGATFFGLICLSIFVLLSSNDSILKFAIIALATANLFQCLGILELYFQANVMAKYTSLANIITIFFSAMIKILMIYFKASLFYFVAIILLEAIFLAFLLIYFYQQQGSRLTNWRFSLPLSWRMISASWPLLLASMAVTAYLKIDQVMIKNLLGVEAVGEYAAALRVSEVWYFIPIAFTQALFPAIINAKKKGGLIYLQRLQNLLSMLFWMAFVLAIIVSFFHREITALLYGNRFLNSSTVLLIHIWNGIFVAFGVGSSRWYLLENLQILAFWRTFTGLIINIVLNWMLIPIYSIQGAAFATLITQASTTLFFDLFNVKTRHLFVLKVKSILLINSGINIQQLIVLYKKNKQQNQ